MTIWSYGSRWRPENSPLLCCESWQSCVTWSLFQQQIKSVNPLAGNRRITESICYSCAFCPRGSGFNTIVLNKRNERRAMVSNLLMQGVGMTSQRTRERLIQRLVEQGVTDLRVLDVIRNTPRHLFLDEALAHRAYEDTALPIGHGQTLSQPYIVARMTEILLGAAGKLDKVLEVGTGSGYQTSILAQLVPT